MLYNITTEIIFDGLKNVGVKRMLRNLVVLLIALSVGFASQSIYAQQKVKVGSKEEAKKLEKEQEKINKTKELINSANSLFRSRDYKGAIKK